METLTDIIQLCFNGFIYLHTLYFLVEFVKIAQDLYTRHVQINMVELVLSVSSMANNLYDKYEQYTPAIIKRSVCHTGYCIQWISAKWGNYRIEPYQSSWLCIFWRTSTGETTRVASEYYDMYHIFSYPTYNRMVRNIKNLISVIPPSFSIKEIMIIIAKRGKRITRIIYQSSDVATPAEPFNIFEFFKKLYTVLEKIFLAHRASPTTVAFLAVSYTNPCMPGGEVIHLQIPVEDWFENNEILSYAYVLRLLEYQSNKNVIINDDYVIVIIDRDIKKVEVRSNQFIKLYANGYELVTV